MAAKEIIIRVRVAWWVRWYLAGCKWFAILHGVQPDIEKIQRQIVTHGLKVEVESGR